MGLLDEIDETFATETAKVDEGKNGTSIDGDEPDGDEPDKGSDEPDGDEPDGDEPDGDEPEEKKEPEKGEKKHKNGVQKRIDELTKRNYELQRKLEDATRQEPQARKMPEPPDPKNFQTLSEFNTAKAVYEAEVKFTKQAIADDEKRAHEDVQRSVADKIRAEKDRYEDFAEVVENIKDVSLHDDVLAGLVINDPNGVDTLYWLGNHVKQAIDISRLKPAEQALALGRISANIKAQRTGKQVSGAPKPPAKVGGKGGAATPDFKKMSGDEYIAWRKSQEAKKSKR